MRWFVATSLALFAACGPSDSYRPLEIEIFGVSARSASVSLKVFAFDTATKCNALEETSIKAAVAHVEQTWDRSNDRARSWVIPQMQTESFTLAVYTQDDANKIMQYVCRQINYSDIGKRDNGVLTITLAPREDL